MISLESYMIIPSNLLPETDNKKHNLKIVAETMVMVE